jgi:dihydroxy-acid dehydratase
MGYSRDAGRPVVGIAYTPSGFNNCHRHFPELLEAVPVWRRVAARFS